MAPGIFGEAFAEEAFPADAADTGLPTVGTAEELAGIGGSNILVLNN